MAPRAKKTKTPASAAPSNAAVVQPQPEPAPVTVVPPVTPAETKKGIFICFEGMDGVGKSTLIERVMSYVMNRSKKYDHVLVTREPTYGPVGSRIRELLARDPDPMGNAKMYAELYVEDRTWHYNEHIKPALERGYVVLADRFKYSTIAFQQTQGLSFEELRDMQQHLPAPDLTILLDAPAEICMERIANRQGVQRDKFDQLEFLTKLRSFYTALPKQMPRDRMAVVNASLTRDWAWQQTKKILETPGLLPY